MTGSKGLRYNRDGMKVPLLLTPLPLAVLGYYGYLFLSLLLPSTAGGGERVNDLAFYQSLATASAAMVSITSGVFLNRVITHSGLTHTQPDNVQRRLSVLYGKLLAGSTLSMSNTNLAEEARTVLTEMALTYKSLDGRRALRGQVKQLLREIDGYSGRLGSAWGQARLDEQRVLLSEADRDLFHFAAQARPLSLWCVLIIIVWLTVAGVGYPLAVLTEGVREKCWLLIAVDIGVAAFEGFLFFELLRLQWWRLKFRWWPEAN